MKINPVRVLFGIGIGVAAIHLVKKYKENKQIKADAANFDLPDLEPEALSTNLSVLYKQQQKAYDDGDMKRYMEISDLITEMKASAL